MATVTSATSFFPTAKEGFTTTLASTVASGATTVPLNSVSGYNNGDVVALVVDPTSSTAKQVFSGVVDTSGVQITSVVWTEGTNQVHTSGATVVDYETATAWALQAKGFTVAHNQNGTHLSGAAYASPIFSGTATGTYTLAGTPTITSPTISSPTLSGTVTGQVIGATNLTTSAITLGYTQTTGNFTTTSATPVIVTSMTSTVTIPAGGRSIKISVYTSGLSNSGINGMTVTLWDGTVGSGTQLQAALYDPYAASAHVPILMQAVVTPSAGSKTYNVGLAASAGTATWAASSTAPSFILVEAI